MNSTPVFIGTTDDDTQTPSHLYRTGKNGAHESHRHPVVHRVVRRRRRRYPPRGMHRRSASKCNGGSQLPKHGSDTAVRVHAKVGWRKGAFTVLTRLHAKPSSERSIGTYLGRISGDWLHRAFAVHTAPSRAPSRASSRAPSLRGAQPRGTAAAASSGEMNSLQLRQSCTRSRAPGRTRVARESGVIGGVISGTFSGKGICAPS